MYPEQSTAHLENVANITANSDSVILQEKQNWSKKIAMRILTTKKGVNKSIEEIACETIEQNGSNKIDFKPYLENMIQETNLMTTPLGKSITRNMIMGTEDQVLLPTEIEGSVKFLVGIANPFRTHTANLTDLTIQPIIFHSNQVTGTVHSDRY